MAKTPIENLRLRRTQQSTIHEAASAVILLFMWIATIVAVARHKADIALLIPQTVFTLVVMLFHYFSYRPTQRWVRNSFDPKTIRQAIVASKFYRIFAIEVAMLSLFIPIDKLTHFTDKMPDIITGSTFVGIITATHIIADRKIAKVRKAERQERRQNKSEE